MTTQKPANVATAPTPGRSEPAGEALAGEIWKPVVGYEGLYEVSNMGRVRSLARTTWCAATTKRRACFKHYRPRIMKPSTNSRLDAMHVSLHKSGVRCVRKVHHLVAEAFIGPRPANMECCHNDGDPTNNQADNLRWDTSRGNHADRFRHGTMTRGEKHHATTLTDEQVRDIRERYTPHRDRRNHGNAAQLALEHGVRQAVIWDIASGRTWKHLA